MNNAALRHATTQSFRFTSQSEFKQRALAWSMRFERVAYLDSNGYPEVQPSRYEALLAVGVVRELIAEAGTAFQQLQAMREERPSWLFGFLGYDLKNEVEQLASNLPDGVGMPDMHFFEPEIVLEIDAQAVRIHSDRLPPELVFKAILHTQPLAEENNALAKGRNTLKSRFSKEEYCQTVARIREHIIAGDIYEMNFCQEFFLEQQTLNPYHTFQALNSVGKAPFSTLYRLDDRYLLSASPERFLYKKGNQLISQPIKGTIKRGDDLAEDIRLKHQLANSAKDRSENVMIVDLVRNDLARSCQPGSIQVDELFGIYSFEQVHQMISTVSGQLRNEINVIDAIRFAFPMGSMTGAPKIRSMQLIEQYERSRRGLYSGAVGYFTPAGDFDFNVVIRSILYDATREYLSFQVGGAIVYDSVPELEYEECLLKAKGILEVLGIKRFQELLDEV